MNKVVIVSGISGSGKSSYIRTLSDKVWYPHFKSGVIGGAVICSADHYFMTFEGKYKFDFTKLSNAHGSCFRNFIASLMNEQPLVIVDNTNLSAFEISPYVLGGESYGYDVSIVTIMCQSLEDVKKATERNAHGVPYAAVLAQHKRLEERVLPPWWKNTVIPFSG